MKYINNPQLKTIKEDHEGNILDDKGRFYNYHKVTRPAFKDILHWWLNKNPQKAEKQQDKYYLDSCNDPQLFDRTLNKISWLGHASFLITINGKNILTDPVFDKVSGYLKRRSPIPFTIHDYTSIDYILISHSHYDHLDRYTLTTLAKQNPDAIIYCGLGHTDLIRKWHINNTIIEAGWYQQYPIRDDNIQFYFMPTLHWSKRTLKDDNTRLWGSFVIHSSLSTLYFMGDSGYASHFQEIGQLFPSIDYAILGVGAYMPRAIMQYSHINPEEAYQAFQDIGAKYLVPMHYATYNLTDEPFREPLTRITQLVDKQLKSNNIGTILPL